jgi:hypothetical protein
MALICAPGAHGGPCLAAGCSHIICAMKRDTARSKCARCGREIGYGKNFSRVGADGLVHESCKGKRVRAGVPKCHM